MDRLRLTLFGFMPDTPMLHANRQQSDGKTGLAFARRPCLRYGPARHLMNTAYHTIYISPHFDDAILSCGGQIATRTRRGQPVLIVTLAAGQPDGAISEMARELHAGWQRTDLFAARREEDRLACGRLGAEWLHIAVPDSIYRRHPISGDPLYPTVKSLFGGAHPSDTAGQEWIAALRKLPAAETVVAPLGVGGHADHRLTRYAADHVFGPSLWYYEDFPYSKRLGAVRMTTWPPWSWRSCTIPLTPADVKARCEASAIYSSQIDTLAGGRDAFTLKTERYIRRIGGERIWQKRQYVSHCEREAPEA